MDLPQQIQQMAGRLVPLGLLQIAGLIFARILPIVAFTPLFGGETIPRRMRLGIGVLLTLALIPGFAAVPAGSLDALRYAALTVKEALVGFTLAMFVLVLFETYSAFGALVDLARGATIGNILDPLTRSQQPILSVFFTQLAIVLFFAIGGHRVLLSALADSFILVRPLEAMPGRLVGAGSTGQIVAMVGEMFLIAVRLSAPVVVVVLLLDVALGLINKAAPQIQVYFLGLTIKGSLGIFMVLLVLALGIHGEFAWFLRLMKQWIGSAG